MVSNKKALQSLQFSQREFAQVAGISTTTVKSFLDSGVLVKNEAGKLSFNQLENYSSYYLSKGSRGTLYLTFIDNPDDLEATKTKIQELESESRQYVESADDIFASILSGIKPLNELAADAQKSDEGDDTSVFSWESSIVDKATLQISHGIVDTFIDGYLDLVNRVMLKLCFSESKSRSVLIAPEETDLVNKTSLGVLRDFVYYADDNEFSEKCPQTAQLINDYIDMNYNRLFVDKATKKLGSSKHFIERADITEEFLNKSGDTYKALLSNSAILDNERHCVFKAAFLDSLREQFRNNLNKVLAQDYYSFCNINVSSISADDVFTFSNMISSGLYHNLVITYTEQEFMTNMPDALKSVIDAAKRNSSIAVKFL